MIIYCFGWCYDSLNDADAFFATINLKCICLWRSLCDNLKNILFQVLERISIHLNVRQTVTSFEAYTMNISNKYILYLFSTLPYVLRMIYLLANWNIYEIYICDLDEWLHLSYRLQVIVWNFSITKSLKWRN